MDSPTAKVLRSDLQKILDARAEELMDLYEIEIIPGGTYDDTEVTFKLRVREKGADTQEQKALKHFAPFYDIDINKEARANGSTYKLWGYRTKARTKPFLMLNLTKNDGEHYLADEDTVRLLFKKDEEVANG